MEIRKAFILAAGSGTRLRPLTYETPKCLLPLGGEPILHWWLRLIDSLGVQEVMINAHHLAEKVASFLCSRDYKTVIHFSYEPRLLGSAGTIAVNRSFVGKEKSFWIFYADTVIAANLKEIAELHQRNRSCLTFGLFRPPDPKGCGVIELGPDNHVLSLEEKPRRPKSDLAAAGACLAGPRLLHILPRGSLSRPLDLGKDVLPKLVRCASGTILDGPVIDIGTPAGYARAQREWSKLSWRQL